MLDKEISAVLAYAENMLMMDELDAEQAVRRICSLLHLDGFIPAEPDDSEEIPTTPTKLLEPLLNYALEQKIATPETVDALRAEIMDAVMLRPSEINDLFNDTYAVNKQKAFDFLYDYCVKDGYVDLDRLAKNDRWEAKELKSKIEIIINLMPASVTDGYPACPLCLENEGYKDRANMRSVITEIGGDEFYFGYSRHQYFERHGVLCALDHKPMPEDKKMLEKLALAADFVGSDGFVGTNGFGESSGAHNTAHAHFQTGFRSTPMFRADVKKKLKSKEYPYIEMNLLDWYCTVIRFSHSNLEKTVEFADKLNETWKRYSDARIQNNDGKKNFCNFIVRKIGGKYVFDAVLRSNGVKKAATSPEYSEIKPSALSLNDILGYFVLPNKLSGELKKVQLYLDGTIPFDSNKLDPDMKSFEKMIARMLKEQGGTVTKLEAKLNIHDEVDAVCEKILAGTSVFDGESILPFLELMGIEEK